MHYQIFLQFISVAVLLRDVQSVYRIIRLMNSHRQLDTLFEFLISSYTDNYDVNLEEYFHDKPPYKLLMSAVDVSNKNPEKALDIIEKYLKKWYKPQEGTRWYNEHLDIKNNTSLYYGYWAFEAGLAAYKCDLNDSTIEHMTYPHHLVEYARKLYEEDRWTSPDVPLPQEEPEVKLRVEANQPCTKTGYWWTVAKEGSHRHFNVGDNMPDFPDSQYGATIWMWSQDQSSH